MAFSSSFRYHPLFSVALPSTVSGFPVTAERAMMKCSPQSQSSPAPTLCTGLMTRVKSSVIKLS